MKHYFISLIVIFTWGCVGNSHEAKESANKAVVASDSIILNSDACVFKTNEKNECWTRLGVYPLDSVAEDYACKLRQLGSENILLAKYIGDNGAFPNESAFVLWTDGDKGYVQKFMTPDATNIIQKPRRELDWKSLRKIADSLRLDTVMSRPQYKIIISHDRGLAVQYNSPKFFFCERLQETEWKSALDKTHPKVVFWNKLTNLLNLATN